MRNRRRWRYLLPRFDMQQVFLWTVVASVVFAFAGRESAMLLLIVPPAVVVLTLIGLLDRRQQFEFAIQHVRNWAESPQLSDDQIEEIAVLILEGQRRPKEEITADIAAISHGIAHPDIESLLDKLQR